MRLVGSAVGIPQWLKGLLCAKCVFIGPVGTDDVDALITHAIGLLIPGFKTVAPSSCTSCHQRLDAVCVTVATI